MKFKLFCKRLAIAGLLAAIIWTGWQVARVSYQKWQLNAQVQDLKQQAKELEQQNRELKELVNAFDNPEFLKLQAKEKFNLKQKGEEVIVVVPPEQQEKDEQQAKKSENNLWQKGNLSDWWQYYFEK